MPVKRIGKYEVLDVLGKGGMGVVYKATDPSIGRLVAIKMITSGFCDDPDFLRRFYREAQSTGKLQHQNIVIVHELGDQDGAPFLVMEYLEGESLQGIINAQRPMSLLDKLDLIIQACNGLHYAHQRNIVHRDIKPANIMVVHDGIVKIVDFGIARIETENVTVPGQVVGTIQYMSPEQINGAPVDCRTDIFSTAVVMYQLLTHSLPFQGKDTGSTLLKIINEPPPPLGNFLDVYPADLDLVMERALAKPREDRYATAEDFAFDLALVQDQLKRELVSEYLKIAEDLVAQSELTKAKEQVSQILKVDRQNRRANDLLKDIQKLIQKQQRSEQARQLRASADEAIASGDLERAIQYMDEALRLDKQNPELEKLRADTLQAKARVDKMQEALHRAESARYAGELDEALAAVEEALRINADSAQAQRLHADITHEISERNRSAQIQQLVSDAQRHISARRFTTAIEALQKAEALDPTAAGIKDLKALAETGREQERRRKDIEQLSAEIQEALNRDDYLVGCAKAEQAVQRFPNENGLLKLQALAQRQRQAGEKRRFVEEHISRARKLLEERKTEEALATLEKACKRFPSEPALLSLLTVVRENLEHDRAEARKQDYIQRAKEALRRKDYGEATDILQTASAELNAPEIDDLLQFVKEEAAGDAKRRAMDAAAEEVQRLLATEDYEDAIAFLNGVLQDNSDDELQILLAEAQRQLSDFNRRVQDAIATAERLMRADRFIEATRYLESQAGPCGRSAEFRAALERTRHEQERMHAIASAVQSARMALSSQDFAAAAVAVEQCRNSVGDHPDLSQIAGEIDSRRREAANKAMGKALADVRMLLLGRSYQSAIEMLDGVAGSLEFVGSEIRERYHGLYEEAARGFERSRKKADSASVAPPPAVDDDDTEAQLEWKMPSTGVTNRERDIQELAALAHESATVTTHGELKAITERARLIAGRHPGDADVDTIAAQVVNSTGTTPAPSASGSIDDTLESLTTIIAESEVEAGAEAQKLPTKIEPLRAPVHTPAAPPPRKPTQAWPVLAVVGGLLMVVAVIALLISQVRKSAPTPGTSAVVVRTNPEGAAVQVGDAKCVVPHCSLRLPPGTYKIEATLAGYEPQAAEVQVEKGKAAPPVSIVLTPIPPILRINTNFSRGNTWLDDRETGPLANGQLAINALSAGQHKVRVAGPDGEAEFNFTATPGGAPALKGAIRARDVQVLVASSVAGQAQLACNCTGPLPLAVDGRPSGELSASGLSLGNLGPGVHELQLGTGDDARSASLKLGMAPALEVFLNAARNVGTLVVDAGVDNADVIVNGKAYRTAAGGTLRVPLNATDYTVRVQKAGYVPAASQHASIRKNQETRLTFNLTPRAQKSALAIAGGVPGARVGLDGNSVGVLDGDGQFVVADLKPGKHVIEMAKAGYKPRSLDRVLKGGETLSLSGEEVKLAKLAPPPEPPEPPKAEPPRPDPSERDWQQTRNSSDSKAFEAYAAKYPDSAHAAEAKRKGEQLDWERVRGSNDPGQLQAFVTRHPGSEFAAPARAMLEKFNATRANAEHVNGERTAVLQVIKDYAAAYGRKDVSRIENLYPGLGKQQVKKLHDVFRTAKDVRMELQPTADPEIKGDSATVICRRSAQYTYPEGIQKPPDDIVTIQFKKSGNAWVMDSIQ